MRHTKHHGLPSGSALASDTPHPKPKPLSDASIPAVLMTIPCRTLGLPSYPRQRGVPPAKRD